MNVVYLREPEDICPSEFPEDPHHDCKETIDYLERDNAALKLFISGQEAENAELKSRIERMKNCMNCKHGNSAGKCKIEPFELWVECVKSDCRKHWAAKE